MSTSNESDLAAAAKVTLDVNTGDDSAEIFVIDGQFNLVGRGIGPYQGFALDPGIYKVKVVAGAKTREEHVVLRPGSQPVQQEFSPLLFSTPAPLDDTAMTHEFHVAAASEHSRRVHFSAGLGSWIFVCARGWSEKTQTDSATYERPHPARGLKLLNEYGEMVVDFEEWSEKDLGWEPWAACNVSVAPGIYRLQLEAPALGRTVEQTIVASPRWQTQIFLLQRDYGQDTHEAARRGVSDMRADLSGASVLMSGPGYTDHLPPPPPGLEPPPGFNPGERALRQVELARLALLNQRKIISEELRSLLRYKAENPKPGIFPNQAPPRKSPLAGVMHSPVTFPATGELGVGAGGKIEQRIYPDPYGVETWDSGNSGEVFIYLISRELYCYITGLEPPRSPISARTYTEHGLGLWFELADESLGDLAAPQNLSGIKSVRQIDAERGLDSPDEETSIELDETRLRRLRHPSEGEDP